MPSLPFTFEDLKNADPFDSNRTVDVANKSADPTAAGSVGGPQGFLTKKINQLKDSVNSTEGLIDLGMSINPGLRYVDMASKFFGGPGVAEGFKQGVTQPVGDKRSEQSEIRLPPMPF